MEVSNSGQRAMSLRRRLDKLEGGDMGAEHAAVPTSARPSRSCAWASGKTRCPAAHAGVCPSHMRHTPSLSGLARAPERTGMRIAARCGHGPAKSAVPTLTNRHGERDRMIDAGEGQAGSRIGAQGPQVLGRTWLLAALRDLMDRRVALEHLAPYVLAGIPPPAEAGRAGRRLIAKETTRTRTLEEDVAILTGGSIADAPPRRTRPDD